jgi:hypothetical protein
VEWASSVVGDLLGDDGPCCSFLSWVGFRLAWWIFTHVQKKKTPTTISHFNFKWLFSFLWVHSSWLSSW